MPTESPQEIRDRLGLTDGQFFAVNLYKNLWWYLNDMPIGYGDITLANVGIITKNLDSREVFTGYFEQGGDDPEVRKLAITMTSEDVISHRLTTTVAGLN